MSQQTSFDSTSINFNGVQAVGSETAYAVGSGNTVMKTEDQGSTWVRLETTLVNMDLRSLFFLNEVEGWVVGKATSGSSTGVVVYTANSGVSWQEQSSPVSTLYRSFS